MAPPQIAAEQSLALWFPPEMVVEIALGADHPHDIAERHGIDAVDYEHLVSLPWFEELVARKRVELQDHGYMFRAKAAMMAEALLTRLFQQSMAGKVTHPIMVDVSKQLIEVGNLKPTPNAAIAAGAGSGFQINIQINGQGTDLGNTTAPVKPAAAGAAGDSAPALTVDFRPVDKSSPAAQPPQGASGLPEKPAYIHASPPPNFDRDAVVRGRPRFGLGGAPSTQAHVAGTPVGLPKPPGVG